MAAYPTLILNFRSETILGAPESGPNSGHESYSFSSLSSKIFKETIRDFGVDSEAMKMEEEDGIIGNVRDAMAKVESDVIDIFELAQDMADNEK